MTLPPPPPPPPPAGPPMGGAVATRVHEPDADDREPRTRPRMMFFDRAKVTIVFGLFLLLMVMYKQSQVPVLGYAEVVRDQLRAKWWIVGLVVIEWIRQIHYLISERSEGWHGFWQRKVFGAWETRMSKLDPWLRYRLSRVVRVSMWLTILGFVFAWKWGLSWVQAIAQAPGRFFDILFKPMTGGMPMAMYFLTSAISIVFYMLIFFGMFFVGGIDTYKPGEIKTRFRDVWGQDPVLARVQETVDFLERPEEIEAKGGYVPGGLLLWGPPGTGKTLMAEAIAGETGKPYVFCDPSAFIQTFMGVAPMKIKWLYRKLRKLALKYGGVVVFFDEADALGNRGGQSSGQFDATQFSAWRAAQQCNGHAYVSEHAVQAVWTEHARALSATHAQEPGPRRGIRGIIMGGMGGGMGGSGALQSLLTEMSGLKKPKGFLSRRLRSFLGIRPRRPPKYRILHVMATNRPDSLDSALLRPGRIDRIYKVGYPHREGRKRTFEGYFAKVRHELTDAQIEKLSLITPYYTGASVKNIVNESVIVALRDGRDLVTWPDVLRAKLLKTHGEADDWTYTDLERHQVAVHEACHAVAMYVLQKIHTIDVATIERRGGVGGFVAPIPLEERFGEWRSEMEIDVMTYLASLAGERHFFGGDNSSGVGGDLRSSTMIVMRMQSFWGMGETVASRAVTIPEMTGASSRPSDGVDRALLDTLHGTRIEAKLQDLLARVSGLLVDNAWFVYAVAHALEEHLTITGEDIDAIYCGTQGPTLDGRMYHTDDFKVSYEAYHLSAVDAHQTQHRNLRPLPVASTGVPGGVRRFGPPH